MRRKPRADGGAPALVGHGCLLWVLCRPRITVSLPCCGQCGLLKGKCPPSPPCAAKAPPVPHDPPCSLSFFLLLRTPHLTFLLSRLCWRGCGCVAAALLSRCAPTGSIKRPDAARLRGHRHLEPAPPGPRLARALALRPSTPPRSVLFNIIYRGPRNLPYAGAPCVVSCFESLRCQHVAAWVASIHISIFK